MTFGLLVSAIWLTHASSRQQAWRTQGAFRLSRRKNFVRGVPTACEEIPGGVDAQLGAHLI